MTQKELEDERTMTAEQEAQAYRLAEEMFLEKERETYERSEIIRSNP